MTTRTIVMLAGVLAVGCNTDGGTLVKDTDSGSTSDATDAGGTTDATTTGGGSSSGDGTGSTSGASTAGTEPCEGDYAQVVYLNFDGVTLVKGEQHDARTNEVAFQEWVGDYAPYDGEFEDVWVDRFREDVAPFNVCVTTDRPSSGEYSMIVVTASDIGGLALGPAPDCGNQNKNDIGFVRNSANGAGFVFGVMCGLDPVVTNANNPDLLEISIPAVDADYVDGCREFANGFTCADQHEAACPKGSPADFDRQNSHQELLTLLGPAK